MGSGVLIFIGFLAGLANIFTFVWLILFGSNNFLQALQQIHARRKGLQIKPIPMTIRNKFIVYANLIIGMMIILLLLIDISRPKVISSGETGNTPQPSATKGAISTSTTLPRITPTFTVTATTPTSTPTPTKTPIQLGCGGCDDPILVTLKTFTIDTATQKMTWNITLYNKTGVGQHFEFTDFSLKGASSDGDIGTGDILTQYRDYNATLDSGMTTPGMVFFSFAPNKGVSYTFTAQMIVPGYKNGQDYNIVFDPIPLIF